MTKTLRHVTSATLLLLAASLAACGGGGGADKLDTAALKAGASTSAKLKFWMKEKGMRKGGLADNIHLDDANNVRVVLYYEAGLKDKVDQLKQNDVHKVTFTVDNAGTAKMVEGTLTAID